MLSRCTAGWPAHLPFDCLPGFIMRGAMSIDPRSIPGPGFWTRQSGWASETRQEAISRLDKRARDFVNTLIAVVRQEPIFLRNTGQSEDSFFVFDRPVNPFAVQLDPAIEVVVVFDLSSQQEFGDWNGDRYADALVAVQDGYGIPE
jgi:hypothetical protein